MVKVYNGKVETIFNPDRLYLKDASDGGKVIEIAKYFGVGPDGEPKGISEEVVKISYPWLGNLKLFLDEGNGTLFEIMDNFIGRIKGENLEKEEFVKEASQRFDTNRENLEYFHTLVRKTEEKALKGGTRQLRHLLFKLEDELLILSIDIKNALAVQEVLNETKINEIVSEKLKFFDGKIKEKYAIHNITEIIAVKIFPFP